jgi:hypothetical protein
MVEALNRSSGARKARMFRKESCMDMKRRLAGTEVAIALTGHPVRGCTGELTSNVFKLAGLIG